MITVEQLERDLTEWFAETAAPGTPEFAENVVLETAGIRQRSRWTFIPLLPRPMAPTLPGLAGRVPPRRVAIVLAIVGLALLAVSAVWVGSQPSLPPPFGAASNGLVAYEKGGDIFVVDPATGERRGLVLGPERDVYPRWSLDGTRLAFLRGPEERQRLVVVDAAGTVQSEPGGDAFRSVDPDSIAWAPDGRTVLVTSSGRIHLVDAVTARATALPVAYWGLDAHWRPPDGRELLFVGGSAQSPALFRYAVADGQVTEVPGTKVTIPASEVFWFRPIGWTADGSRFAYHRKSATRDGFETRVLNVDTGDALVLDVAFGRISNDGTRILGVATDGDPAAQPLCVAPVDGGPCERIAGSVQLVDLLGSASFQWAPDDTWIRSQSDPAGPATLLSPVGAPPQQPAWAAEGAESWQRRAP
jgi:hypothetical protein